MVLLPISFKFSERNCFFGLKPRLLNHFLITLAKEPFQWVFKHLWPLTSFSTPSMTQNEPPRQDKCYLLRELAHLIIKWRLPLSVVSGWDNSSWILWIRWRGLARWWGWYHRQGETVSVLSPGWNTHDGYTFPQASSLLRDDMRNKWEFDPKGLKILLWTLRRISHRMQ